MRTVERDVLLQESGHAAVRRAGERLEPAPKQPVMHNHQVGLGRDSQLDGREARIHRGGNARDRAAIFHLQTVDGSFPIAEVVRAQ